MIIAFITIWVLCFYWNLVIWKNIYNEIDINAYKKVGLPPPSKLLSTKEVIPETLRDNKLMGSIMLVTMLILGPVALISSIVTKYV